MTTCGSSIVVLIHMRPKRPNLLDGTPPKQTLGKQRTPSCELLKETTPFRESYHDILNYVSKQKKILYIEQLVSVS